MAYTIEWGGVSKTKGTVSFVSKTRVGLNEEIDRFIMENKPDSLHAMKGDLIPEYSRAIHRVTGPRARRWRVTMHFTGLVKD